MEKLISVRLHGHESAFLVDEEAGKALEQYLSRARLQLGADPDRGEVLRDLENSIGDKLTGIVRRREGSVRGIEMQAVLDEIGMVDTGYGSPPAAADSRSIRKGRFLCRIREGQDIAGVCNGLAAYSEFDVAWVRTIFVLATVFTGGFFLLVYLVLLFVLPVVPSYTDYVALRDAQAG